MAESHDQNDLARPSGRLIQLDLLRGIAILLVLFSHPPTPVEAAGRLARLAATLQRFGGTGVELFFVLSGFLIGGLLFGEIRKYGNLNVGRFLTRRGFKIWPSYYAFLGFVAVQLYRHRPSGQGLLDAIRPLVPSLLNVQNYLGSPRAPLWSLGVEEHFYVILPFLLLGSLKLHRTPSPSNAMPGIVPTVIALVMVCTALRCYVNFNFPYDFMTHHAPTHLRCDALALGVLLAYLHQLNPSPLAFAARRPGLLAMIGVVLVAPMTYFELDKDMTAAIWGFTALDLGYSCLVLALISTPARGWLVSLPVRLVAFIGVFSYPIYLWHSDAGVAGGAKLASTSFSRSLPAELQWVVGMTGSIVLATLAGVVASVLIERPALAARDRFFPSRTRATAQPIVRQEALATSPKLS